MCCDMLLYKEVIDGVAWVLGEANYVLERRSTEKDWT